MINKTSINLILLSSLLWHTLSKPSAEQTSLTLLQNPQLIATVCIGVVGACYTLKKCLKPDTPTISPICFTYNDVNYIKTINLEESWIRRCLQGDVQLLDIQFINDNVLQVKLDDQTYKYIAIPSGEIVGSRKIRPDEYLNKSGEAFFTYCDISPDGLLVAEAKDSELPFLHRGTKIHLFKKNQYLIK